MKRFSSVLGILLVATSASAQDPVKIDPSHHKVEIDNALVRVLRLTLNAKEKTPLYDHPAGVALFLTDGTYRIGAATAKSENRKRGEVALLTAGKHAIENLGTAAAEMVIVELKTPPMKPWKPVALDPLTVDPNNFAFIAENDYVRVIRGYTKDPSLEHEHGSYVFVWMDGPALPFGTVRFEQGPVKHAPKPQPSESIMVELKTQPAAEK